MPLGTAQTAFEVTADDVVAAAESRGLEMNIDTAQAFLDGLGREQLDSIAMAALAGDDLEGQALIAQGMFADILVDKGLIAASPRLS